MCPLLHMYKLDGRLERMKLNGWIETFLTFVLDCALYLLVLMISLQFNNSPP